MSGRLTVIPTPIGNLADLTFRALDTLKTVDLLLCEDTRHTGKLLQHYAVQVPMLSYHKFNERERTEMIAAKIADGDHIGLVSDAGMPGISDPGELLIRALIEQGLPVEVLPGANAAVTALVGAGLPVAPFLFLGFLSGDKRARKRQWEKIKQSEDTLILYESPKRIRKTIARLYEELGNRSAAVCRELTKLHEETIRSDLGTLTEHPERIPEKGEFVLVIGPPTVPKAPVDATEPLKAALKTHPLSVAVKQVAQETGLPRNELYAMAVAMKEGEDGSDS